MSETVDTFRAEYRRTHIGARYNGWLHLAFTMTMGGGIIAFCASRLNPVSGWEWLAIPLTFLYANFAEYFGHRGPMHHPRKGLGKVFERHTRQHHRFFTETRMEFGSARDFKAVLFPPILVTFFLLAFGTPILLLLNWLTTANVAYLFGITGTAYFLNYELLHFAHHLPPEHWVARLPVMRALRRHHTIHHDQTLMTHYHFNITYPLADWLMGTLYRPKDKNRT